MRRAISMASWSLKAAGAERSELSIEIATSALLRAGRLLVPEKITSSIEEARMDLYEDSPITQRSASTRLDLPQPFGPTTPVSPGSIRKSVGSTNDLNPVRRSRVSFMVQASSRTGAKPVVALAFGFCRIVILSGELPRRLVGLCRIGGRMNRRARLSNSATAIAGGFPDLSHREGRTRPPGEPRAGPKNPYPPLR